MMDAETADSDHLGRDIVNNEIKKNAKVYCACADITSFSITSSFCYKWLLNLFLHHVVATNGVTEAV